MRPPSPQQLKQLQTDPLAFNRMFFPRSQPYDKQREIWQSVINYKRTVVRASFGVGKSWVAARIVLWFFYTFPRSLVIFTAPTFTLLSSILWKEMKTQNMLIPFETGFEFLETPIAKNPNYPDHRILGFTVQKQVKESYGSLFQGQHAQNLLVVLDESAGIEKWVFEGAQNMCVGTNNRVLSIGNSIDPGSHFCKLFKSPSANEPAGWNKLSITAFDSPNVKHNREIIPGLPMRDWVEDIKAEYGEDSPEYQCRVLAEFPESYKNALIPIRWVENAKTRTMDEILEEDRVEGKTVGLDTAGMGRDETVAYLLDGCETRVLFAMRKADTDAIIARLDQELKKIGEVYNIVADNDGGYSAGVISGMKKLGYKNIYGFHSGQRPAEPRKYYNAKMELVIALKQRLKLGNIIIPDEETCRQVMHLKAEPIVHRGHGVIRLETKDKLIKSLGRSPDRMDALLLCFAGYLCKRSWTII